VGSIPVTATFVATLSKVLNFLRKFMRAITRDAKKKINARVFLGTNLAPSSYLITKIGAR